MSFISESDDKFTCTEGCVSHEKSFFFSFQRTPIRTFEISKSRKDCKCFLKASQRPRNLRDKIISEASIQHLQKVLFIE